MHAAKTFARHKKLLACVLVSLGFLFAACVLFAFYTTDSDSVSDAFKHLFGLSSSDDDFVLPTRKWSYPSEEPGTGLPATPEFSEEWFSSRGVNFHSAVLIAGSSGYHNYRHQADVCHAFQILRKSGMREDNIITFVADDIAHNSENPYPGQLFNRPGGEDVYPGCAKDYTGEDVNYSTVIAVLLGDSRAVTGKGSGRVLKHDPKQRVFLFYSDHGSYGTIAMPYGQPIYADQLHQTLNYMVRNNHFDQMLIYLEACESGSMFRGHDMERQNRILAVTASGETESSYATYCPDHGYQTRYIVPNATYIGSCLGDLFSISWMEHTDSVDMSEVFIEDQIKQVRDRTSDFGSFMYGSHVKQYGDKTQSISKQVVGNFLSYFLAPPKMTRSAMQRQFAEQEHDSEHFMTETAPLNAAPQPSLDFSIDQRSADLLGLYRGAAENDGEAQRKLEAALRRRRYIDASIRAAVQNLIEQGHLSSDATVEEYVTTEVNPRPQEQVVKDWACLREIVSAWEHTCTPMTTYAWKYAIALANLCNEGISPSVAMQSFTQSCQSQAIA